MLTPEQQAIIDRRSSVFLQHLQASKRQHIKSSQLQGFSSPSLLENNNVCGIVGFISNDQAEVASSYLMEGLTILQNRGYDSAGICTVARSEKGGKPELVISKYASLNTTSDAFVRLRTALPKHNGHNVGIAHTRWATHGGKTDVNAHPHTDRLGRIALVHNGVIENSHELKEMLKKKHNITFKSETDTEVIAQCIGLGLDDGKSLIDAVKGTLAMLEGTWGLVIVSTVQPDRIIVVRNGSPLLIGLSRGRTFIASEASAFSRHTKEFISLDNGEIAIITADGVAELIGSENGKQVKDRVQMTEEEKAELSPHPYPHWTIREIFEQPEAASRALNYGGRFNDDSHVKLGGLEVNKDWLMKIKHLIIAACGTSYYAALYGAKLLRLLKCFDTVQVIDAAELDSDDFPSADCGLLVISQSGETGDVVRCLTLAEQLNIPRLSVVNKVGSLIARTTGCGVYINAGREMAVASTKAFTCQVIVLSLVTLFFAQNRHHNQYIQERKQLISSLHRAPTSLGMVISALRPKCHEIAKKLLKCQTMFILGKGLGESIAKEGAIKIKEITYTHAEAYSSGALKHGPFALIEPGTPIILVILDDKYKALNITAGFEVKSRGAYVIGITDAKEKAKEVCDEILEIPHNGLLTGLLGVVPMQLIAYELAVLKNIDPDKPRNLAKSVTVL